MSGRWGQQPIRPRLVLVAALSATALLLGIIPAVSVSASGVPAAASGLDLAATQPASSPGHSPVPVFSSANAVSCPRASYCLAVGAYNANDVVGVLTELWDGHSSSVISSHGPRQAVASALDAISCASPTHCLAVGSYTDSSYQSWPLAEVWNGSSWAVTAPPTPTGGAGAGLTGVSCAGASHCVAVGSYTNSSSVPMTLTEFWNGSSWSVVRSPNPKGATNSELSAVSCTSPSVCMATGSDLDAASVSVTLAESWNGSSWSIVRSPDPAGAQSSNLNALSCPSASHCMAVGSYMNSDFVPVTLAESWNGSSWSVVASPTPSGSPISSLYGVSCVSAVRCLAVGHSYSPSSAAKDGTLAESWNGSSWKVVASPSPSTTSQLNGVSCARAAKCLAAGLFFNSSGDYQTLAESWNGSALSIVNQDAGLAGVSCVDAAHCVAVGSYIRRSISVTLAEVWNGNAWTAVRTPNPSNSEGSYLDAVTCLSARRCVAVGYYYGLDNTRRTLVERWNGVRWSIVRSPNPSGAAYSILYGISCTSASRCTAVGSAGARALAEAWDGSTWSVVATPNPPNTAYTELAGVSCTSSSHCLAVGYETDTYYHADLTFAEAWNGSAWSIVPSAAPGKNLLLASVLHGLSCSTSAGCLAVGYHQRKTGTFATFAERWTGHGWVVLSSPSPSGSIYSAMNAISCISTDECLAVGNYFDRSGDFMPLSERWTGTKWDILSSPGRASVPSGISYLLSVSCAASFTCLGTGTHGDPANLRISNRRWGR